MRAGTGGPSLAKCIEARRSDRIHSAEAGDETVAIEIVHPSQRCLIVNRPEAHDHGGRAGDAERPAQALTAVLGLVLGLASALVAGCGDAHPRTGQNLALFGLRLRAPE